MATSHTLNAEVRTIIGTGKLNALRAEGKIPAVIYGTSAEPMNLQLEAKELATLLANSASKHIIVTLDIPSVGKKQALLKDFQLDYLKQCYVHADFQAIDDQTEIQASVPVKLKGEAVGVKLGGSLNQLIHDIELKCLAKDLPDSIEIDVANLDVADTFKVKQLELPATVKPTLNGNVIICIVAETSASKSLKKNA